MKNSNSNNINTSISYILTVMKMTTIHSYKFELKYEVQYLFACMSIQSHTTGGKLKAMQLAVIGKWAFSILCLYPALDRILLISSSAH